MGQSLIMEPVPEPHDRSFSYLPVFWSLEVNETYLQKIELGL
jgi:hypothetical protein